MGKKERAPKMRGFVRKQVSILGVASWVSEVCTNHFEDAGACPTVLEAIKQAIKVASQQQQPLKMAA